MSTAQRRRGAHLPRLRFATTVPGFKQARDALLARMVKQTHRRARDKGGYIAARQWEIRMKFPGSPSGGQ